MKLRGCIPALVVAPLLAGCNRIQSAFAPFGVEAERTLVLTWIMGVSAAVLLVAVGALGWWAVRAREGSLSISGGMRFIAWAGGVFPAVVLLALLLYALPMMKPLPLAEDALRLRVEGEQFWWRMRYRPETAGAVETANELRLPAGEAVHITLAGNDVIHSFWVPGLAGKMDMIPGHDNELVVHALTPGVYRGVCTEFCGLSHALMAFDVVVMAPAEFEAWLEREARPASADAAGHPGRALFDDYGCAGCHRIRGHTDDAGIGPDLTHFGARRTLAAGTLPMSREAIAGFIRHPEQRKPGVRMPAFPHMPADDALRIADYLQELD
ncbi:cytochrome c oxidase subunit II [Coralloluteibacterium stylophorae]|uniref:Cytochrome aa3 subunit 2 n=1 Tax=Coralloluteibacterium stylophorae TaxID=1776034 RepID=A0A8J8AYA4_9GAMM|nr:cytochrome c oxidase subunit II [Coralloluteibacterium stylophorae]MBS7457234.1 cytochrome c oxidase subunit II [Coralloluteibacterium stylophorae]